MKIAVSATGADLESEVDPRFGRCQYLVFVDSETMEFEGMENPSVDAPGGAGIQTAGLAVERGAQAVITGNCGPNAFQVLAAAGVPVLLAPPGTVREAVEKYKAGELQSSAEATTGPASGMRGMGGGPGMGGGRGGGMGGGRGGGMGGGRGGGMGGGRGGGMGGGRGGGMGGGRGGGMGGGRW
jgi:predicted Fe-Mo cluster-binding NifX family protein